MGTNGEIWPITGQDTGDHDQTMTDSLWHGIIESLYKNFAEKNSLKLILSVYLINQLSKKKVHPLVYTLECNALTRF